MTRDSFIFYRSFYQTIDNLPIEMQRNLYRAIAVYGLTGEEVELDSVEKAIWYSFKAQLDANWKRFKNGQRGGAPQGNQNAKKTTEKQPKTTEKQPKTTEKQPNKTTPENEDENTDENGTKKKQPKQPKTTNENVGIIGTEATSLQTEKQPKNNQKQPNVNVNVNNISSPNVEDINLSLTKAHAREDEESKYFNELANSLLWQQQVCISVGAELQDKPDERTVVTYLQIFQNEMKAKDYLHADLRDYKGHFVSWLKLQLKAKEKNNGTAANRSRKDGAAIRGVDTASFSKEDYDSSF